MGWRRWHKNWHSLKARYQQSKVCSQWAPSCMSAPLASVCMAESKQATQYSRKKHTTIQLLLSTTRRCTLFVMTATIAALITGSVIEKWAVIIDTRGHYCLLLVLVSWRVHGKRPDCVATFQWPLTHRRTYIIRATRWWDKCIKCVATITMAFSNS